LGVRVPARIGNFLFTTASTPALGPTQPPIPLVPGVLSLGAKRSGRKSDHSPHLVAEVNARSYTSTPQYTSMAWCSVEAGGELYLLHFYKRHCITRFAAGFVPRTPGFNPRADNMRVVLNEVALRQVFLRIHRITYLCQSTVYLPGITDSIRDWHMV